MAWLKLTLLASAASACPAPSCLQLPVLRQLWSSAAGRSTYAIAHCSAVAGWKTQPLDTAERKRPARGQASGSTEGSKRQRRGESAHAADSSHAAPALQAATTPFPVLTAPDPAAGSGMQPSLSRPPAASPTPVSETAARPAAADQVLHPGTQVFVQDPGAASLCSVPGRVDLLPAMAPVALGPGHKNLLVQSQLRHAVALRAPTWLSCGAHPVNSAASHPFAHSLLHRPACLSLCRAHPCKPCLRTPSGLLGLLNATACWQVQKRKPGRPRKNPKPAPQQAGMQQPEGPAEPSTPVPAAPAELPTRTQPIGSAVPPTPLAPTLRAGLRADVPGNGAGSSAATQSQRDAQQHQQVLQGTHICAGGADGHACCA